VGDRPVGGEFQTATCPNFGRPFRLKNYKPKNFDLLQLSDFRKEKSGNGRNLIGLSTAVAGRECHGQCTVGGLSWYFFIFS